jgi:hypothetical protein
MTPSTLRTPTRWLSISMYTGTPCLPSDVFITRGLDLAGPQTQILKHYRNVTPSSLDRLSRVVEQYTSDGIGKLFPRRDGWLFQGTMQVGVR